MNSPPPASHILAEKWQKAFAAIPTTQGAVMVKNLTRHMDTYFAQRIRELQWTDTPGFCFLAVGGYGRKELCLGSDIDILILLENDGNKDLADMAGQVFGPLWDQGFTLGHGVMTVLQCLDLARTDNTTLTSLLDARVIEGSRQLGESLLHAVDLLLSEKRRQELSAWHLEGYFARHKKAYNTEGILEPDIKEGIGGLRDCNLIHWLAVLNYKAHGVQNLAMRGLLSRQEKEALEKSLSHILRVRNCIHAMTKHPSNHLHFELQPRIAELLGYEDTTTERGVERFLADLNRHLAEIRILCEFFILEHFSAYLPADNTALTHTTTWEPSETLVVTQSEMNDNPHILMEIFVCSCTTGRPLSWRSRQRIGTMLHLVDDTFRRSPRNCAAFENMLMSTRADTVFIQMLETGFLGAFIPELGLVQDRVQFDAYHLFPVGAHTIRVLQYICTCNDHDAKNFFPDLCRFSRDKKVRMAALLHDIGKTGADHAARGAVLTESVLQRFGWPRKERKEVIFLVANHLLLVQTALKRDLDDESVIQDLAFSLQTSTRFHKLTLLTWADSKATGPKAWSTWTRTLLQELVRKTGSLLDQESGPAPPEVQRIMHTRDFLRTRAARFFSGTALETLLEKIPSRYLLQHTKQEILKHLQLITTLENTDTTHPKKFIFLPEKSPISTQLMRLTLISKDRPGLFATITGALALHDMQIVTASLHRWDNGIIVDTFQVTRPPDPLYQDEAWQSIQKTFSHALESPGTLEKKITEKQRFLPVPTHPHCMEEKCVRIDNEESDFYSIVEMHTLDRAGLLYTIAKTLHEADLDVAFAKITTHRDQIQDIFHIQNRSGQKIVGTRDIDRITRRLLERIE